MLSSYLRGRNVSIMTLWALTSAVVAAAVYRRGLVKGNAVKKRGGASRSGVDDEGIAEAESVLSFWFDGSTADNHRMKWFAQVRETCSTCVHVLEKASSGYQNRRFMWYTQFQRTVRSLSEILALCRTKFLPTTTNFYIPLPKLCSDMKVHFVELCSHHSRFSSCTAPKTVCSLSSVILLLRKTNG